MQAKGRTSQFSRTKQRPPATDLGGPQASAESLTPRRSSLAVEDTVDFQFDFLFAATLGSALSLRQRIPGMLSEDQSEAAAKIIAVTYRRISHRVRAKEWTERD
jgi:hypothetical protein